MTDNEIRIAVAEACGKFCKTYKPKADSLYCESCGQLPNTQSHYPTTLPDYPNDLNAMDEAENTLLPEQWDQYPHHFHTGPGNLYWQFLRMKARQRAEAFLRTIGKWKTNQHLLPKSKNKNRS